MTEFRFNTDHTPMEVGGIVDVLRQPRLWIPTEKDYPHHTSWLEKTEAQLASGTKRAMATYMGKEAVGTVIYQRSPDKNSVVEIRNVSVSTKVRGRHVASFLLRNAEIEAVHNDYAGIEEFIVDTKVTNVDMILFLQSHGYTIREITDLYGLDTGLDAVMSKPAAH